MVSVFGKMRRNAEIMAAKAIRSREDIYRGMDEAVADYARKPGSMVSPADAKQKFMTSQTAKSLIADNRWNMMQTVMYGILAITDAAGQLVVESRKQTRLLEQIKDNTRKGL
jgi:uncharacterized membrane protein